jgi:hypothetical protein
MTPINVFLKRSFDLKFIKGAYEKGFSGSLYELFQNLYRGIMKKDSLDPSMNLPENIFTT